MDLRALLLALAVATGGVCATIPRAAGQNNAPAPNNTPAAADAGDQVAVLIDAPCAQYGQVRVYKGAEDRLYRTHPVRLARYDLDAENQLLVLGFNTRLSEEAAADLNRQLRQGRPSQVGGRQPAATEVSAEQTIPVAPTEIRVSVTDRGGQVIGSKRYGAPGRGEVSIDNLAAVQVRLDRKLSSAELRACEVTAQLIYTFKGTVEGYAVVSTTMAAYGRVVENVLNPAMGTAAVPPSPGQFVSREASQQLVQSFQTEVWVKILDLPPGPLQDVVLDTLRRAAAQLTEDRDVLVEAMKAYTIYTPGIGRMEITPTESTLQAFETAAASEFQSKYSAFLKHQSSLARKERDVEKWHDEHHDEVTRKGSAAASGGFSLLKLGSGNASTSGSFDFSRKWSDLSGGERERYRELHTFLSDEQAVDRYDAGKSYQSWKGNNLRKGTEAKTLRLAVLRDFQSVRETLLKAVVAQAKGTVAKGYTASFALLQPPGDPSGPTTLRPPVATFAKENVLPGGRVRYEAAAAWEPTTLPPAALVVLTCKSDYKGDLPLNGYTTVAGFEVALDSLPQPGQQQEGMLTRLWLRGAPDGRGDPAKGDVNTNNGVLNVAQCVMFVRVRNEAGRIVLTFRPRVDTIGTDGPPVPADYHFEATVTPLPRASR